MSIWRWSEFLPAIAAEHRLSLGEGNTPLVRSPLLGSAVGLPNLHFKCEMANPSGTYKDRFAAVALAEMRAAGKRRLVATTSGNTGAALAAYAAAFGVECLIVVVETAPAEKLTQMLAYGARLARVRAFGVDPDVSSAVLECVRDLGQAPDAALQISAYQWSPVGMAGVETIGHELVEQSAALGRPIDHVFAPAGGGGLVLAIARGFDAMSRAGRCSRGPRIECVQPVGNDTIATPLRQGQEKARPVQCETRISGLQVPSVIDGDAVIAACRESGGTGHAVEDDAIRQAQAMLARMDGLLCEPAGAASLAGAICARQAGEISPDAFVVCVLTSPGFKDRPAMEKLAQNSTVPTLDLSELRAMAREA